MERNLNNNSKTGAIPPAERETKMVMYQIAFEILFDRTRAEIVDTFEAVNKEVMNDCEYKYHTDKENQQDTILDNARELLNGYAFGRYIKPVVETVYISE